MGTITITGAMIIIIGWITLIEFDSYPESKREQNIKKIMRSPTYIFLIALMPVGILINMLGGFFASSMLVIVGTFLIFLQGVIVSLLLWNRKRWKSITLLVVIIILGAFTLMPLFIR